MQVDTFAQLQELVRIVKRAGPHGNQFYSRERMADETLGYARLYKTIANHPDASEAEVSRIALGVGPKDNAYLVQRSTLKDILLNSLFALEVEEAGFSPFGVRVYQNDKAMFATRILQSWSWSYSVKLAEQSLAEALQDERWHNALLFLDALREAAAVSGEMTEFERRDKQFNEVLEIYTTAQHASATIDRITCHSAKTTSEDPKIAVIAKPAIERLRRKVRKQPCFTYHQYLWRLQTAALQATGKYREALRITEKFEALSRSKYARFVNRSMLGSIARKRLVCAIRIRDYVAAVSALEDLQSYVDPQDALNSVTAKQLEYILRMHMGEYDRAAAVIDEVRSSDRLKFIPAVHREKWDVFDAFTRLALADPTLKFNRKNLDKRLQGDKAGTNAAAVVLELLLLLRDGNERALLERYDALEAYTKRYLSGEENTQIRAILDLLRLIARHTGDRSELEARAQKYLKVHRSAPVDDPVAGFQVIPIKTLWQWMLKWKYNLA